MRRIITDELLLDALRDGGDKLPSNYSTQILGMQVAWDSTTIHDLKTCPRKYFYRHVLGYSTISEAVDLKFGILIHKGIETYWKVRYEIEQSLGNDTYFPEVHKASVRAAIRVIFEESGKRDSEGNWRPWNTSNEYKNWPNLVRTLVWYFCKYRNDPLKTITLNNGKAAVELSFRLNIEIDTAAGEPIQYSGHLDRAAEDAMGVYVVDAKSTKYTLSDSWMAQWNPHWQMTGYNFGGNVILEKPVKGVIIDAMQICKHYTEFGRGMTHRTTAQLDSWLDDMHYWMSAAQTFAMAGNWPMNDTACYKYGPCDYIGVCTDQPRNMLAALKADFSKKRWNPLDSR